MRSPPHVKCPQCDMTGRPSSISTHIRYAHATDEQRLEVFFSRVNKNGPGGCWLYTGALNKDGYGTLKYKDALISAHRLGWIIANGAPADGAWVLHNCDVRACCNPEHLRLGTVLDNARDITARGRRHSRYEPVENLLHPHLSRRVPGGKGYPGKGQL